MPSSPMLSTRFEEPAESRQAVQAAWRKSWIGGGATVFEKGRMLGYLFADAQFDQLMGRTAWVRLAGHALAVGADPGLFQYLYAEAATSWLEMGCFNHYIQVMAEDTAELAVWFATSFGQQQAYGLRTILPGDANPQNILAGIEIRRARPEDRQAFADMAFCTADYQVQAPVWAPLPPEIAPERPNVLVLASTPTFDPNKFARGISGVEYRALTSDPDQPLYNRALRGTYPPGSTVKPLMALAGLEAGVIRPQDTRLCRGFFQLPNSRHRYRDWKKEGHGTVNMHDAVMASCDVYFYGLAATLGIDRIHESMSRMGFGKPTGIDVEGERGGIMPSTAWKKSAFKKRELQVWFPGETVIVGIGQGYWSATPMQLAHATAVLATRGRGT